MDDAPPPDFRPRTTTKMAPAPAPSSTTTTTSSSRAPPRRTPPFLPTRLETALLAAYPALLAFGTLFSLISPTVRGAPYDAHAQAHAQDAPPSYFAHKGNVFNTVFVKRGWAWVTGAFAAFVLTHPAMRLRRRRRAAAVVRWAAVTAWWVLVTQWCFGPPLIDRGFRVTGGRCEMVQARLDGGAAGRLSGKDIVTGVACKAAGGRWSGGHDVSGHVFLLVLGSCFLLQEVGWAHVAARHRRRGGGGIVVVGSAVRDERCVVMPDGAVKSAAVEAARAPVEEEEEEEEEQRGLSAWDALGLGGKIASVVVVMCWWMILMTAIFFHTWFEKFTGLLVAFTGLYAVYVVPRFVPAVRAVVGLPGV